MKEIFPIKNIEEINLIKNYYKKKGELNDLLMFLLSINTGVNLTRLLNLKVKDVKDKDFLECDTKKLVPLTDEIKKLIKQIIQKKKNTDWLFINQNGNKFERTGIFRKFKEVCSELGLSNRYSVNSWRKTFAYQYYEKYKDLSYLMWRFNQYTAAAALRFICVEENMNFRIKEGVCL